MCKRIITDDFDQKFIDLQKTNKLSINTIEEIVKNEIEEYRGELLKHTEELLRTKINEKELISKKKGNGSKRATS